MRNIFFTLLFLYSQYAIAQPSLKVKVFDANTSKPISGVSIAINGNIINTNTTDANGYFASDVSNQEKPIKIEAKKKGYQVTNQIAKEYEENIILLKPIVEEKTKEQNSIAKTPAISDNHISFDYEKFKNQIGSLSKSKSYGKLLVLARKEYESENIDCKLTLLETLETLVENDKTTTQNFRDQMELFISSFKKKDEPPSPPNSDSAIISDDYLYIRINDTNITDIRVRMEDEDERLIHEINNYSINKSRIELESVYKPNRPQKGDKIKLEIFYKNGNSITKTIQIK